MTHWFYPFINGWFLKYSAIRGLISISEIFRNQKFSRRICDPLISSLYRLRIREMPSRPINFSFDDPLISFFRGTHWFHPSMDCWFLEYSANIGNLDREINKHNQHIHSLIRIHHIILGAEHFSVLEKNSVSVTEKNRVSVNLHLDRSVF